MLVGLSLSLASCGSSFRSPGLPRPRQADPAFVADIAYTFKDRLDVRSAVSDRTIRSLGYFGDELEGGLAISPDGRSVYLTFLGRSGFRIVRFEVADGRRSFIADGYAPAISPNSRMLAYLSGPDDTTVTVRDLASGRTRSIDLASRVDNGADLFNGTKVWLAGSSTLAVIPSDALPELDSTGRRSSRPAASKGCGSQARMGCVILLNVPAAGVLRYERRVLLAGLASSSISALAGDGPNDLITATSTPHAMQIAHVSLSAGHPAITQLPSVPNVTPETFDSTGTHLIYDDNAAGAPRVLLATLGQRGLIAKRILVPTAREVTASVW
jgi:hypothetical protein